MNCKSVVYLVLGALPLKAELEKKHLIRPAILSYQKLEPDTSTNMETSTIVTELGQMFPNSHLRLLRGMNYQPIITLRGII